MKQVNPRYYNQKYFQSISPDFSKKISLNKFHKKYHEISSLTKLTSSDSICDYGCGNGDLSFLLYLKYKCNITAIDYSPSAIKICQTKLKLFRKNTYPKPSIKFLNRNNSNTPKLKNIKAVYFCDVFEHLYPQELIQVITNVSTWGNPLIIVHTDNNNYLRLIRPILNFFNLITGNTTLKIILQNNQFNKQRHVNLTTSKKLKHTMSILGYTQQVLTYPKVDIDTIKQQLGNISRSQILTKASVFIIKKLPFLSPSFYSVYSKNHINS